MERIKQTFFFITKYKYLLTGAFFLIWILFLDQTGIMYKRKLKEEIASLKNKKIFYIESIKKNEKYYQDLLTNPETKEKLAREEYYMSKKNEEVFIIVEK